MWAQPSYKPQNQNQSSSATHTLMDTIALGNFPAANQLMMANGYSPSNDIATLKKTLSHFILVNGDKAIKQLSHIHPDKDMILDNLAKETYGPFAQQGNFSNMTGGQNGYHNCQGCGGNCNKFNNADGAVSTLANSVGLKTENTLNVIAVLAVVGIVAMIVMKNK